jgi:hypothetical protein
MPELKTDWNDFEVCRVGGQAIREREIFDLTPQWFISDYLSKQLVAVLKTFAIRIEAQTRKTVGVRNGDRKADLIAK